MLRKIWIVLGAVALVGIAYLTAFAVEKVQRPINEEDSAGGSAEATTWTVCSSGCDFTSIQAAVDAADGGDTIRLGAETFSGGVVISKDLVVEGVGPEDTSIVGDGSPKRGILIPRNDPPLQVVLRNLAVQGFGDYGLLNGANHVALERTRFVDNYIEVGGSHMTISDSLLGDGGAAMFHEAVITRTLIAGDGGAWGLRGTGAVTLRDSTITGFITGVTTYGDASVHVSSSTITGNEIGIAFFEGSQHRIDNSTITDTSLGVFVAYTSPNFATISRTLIVAEELPSRGLPYGVAPGSCATYLASVSHVTSAGNMLSDQGCEFTSTTDIVNTDPMLLPLSDNGGPTLTHALAPGSPAIDAGGDDCLPTDQRGVARPQDGNGDGVSKCDIGAYELDVLALSIDIKPSGHPNAVNPYARGVIPVAILGSDPFDVANIDVTTLAFGPGGAPIAHLNGHLEDLNYDGIMDLMTHYSTRDTGIACGDEAATLTGETQDGQPFEGTDSIQTVGCREARRPAIWMKDQDTPDSDRRDGPVNIERK